MIPTPARFYHPHNAEHVAVISAQPAQAGTYHVRLERGATAKKLTNIAAGGPFPESELSVRFAEVEQSLRAAGYLPAGVHALLTALQSADPGIRAHAAARLGRLRSRDGVAPILARLTDGVEEACARIDALGALGDPAAVPMLRQQATRKLLSRRRSAVEALRLLGDAQGLAEVRQLALERLPATVRQVLQSFDENVVNDKAVEGLVGAIVAVETSHQGLAVDTLYELATPLPVAAARAYCRKFQFNRPHIWRYVKSILKRAMLRHDHATHGELIYRIEMQGRAVKPVTATVKSGYDGTQQQVVIFSHNTQKYLRRAAWRYLRMLARHRPDEYAPAAAEMIVHYQQADAQDARLSGQWASAYLLNRILWGRGGRLTYDDRRLKFKFRSSKHVTPRPDAREEAYPELWDRQPRAFLRVLGASPLTEVHASVLASFLKSGKHKETLAAASFPEIIALLHAPHVPTATLGLEELQRRFDPQQPKWELLRYLLADERPVARQLGQKFLHLCADLWTRDAERIVEFLGAPHADTRAVVVEAAQAALAQDAAARQALAPRVLAILRAPEKTEGLHDGYAQLARETLWQELNALLTVADLAAMIFAGSPSVQALAGELLCRRPEAVGELGIERLTQMAQHSLGAVRQGAADLLRSAQAILAKGPAPLFVLVESDWPDTRELAFDLLRTIDLAALGTDGLLGLLDSTRVDVQDFGKEMAAQHFASLRADDLVFHLAQHPHPNMRSFVLDLVGKHLPEGSESLAQLRRFFRAAVFDLWPQRKVKHRVIDLLLARGLQDPQQAQVACGVLGDVARLHGRADFERALEALVRLKIAYPDLEASINLWPGGEP